MKYDSSALWEKLLEYWAFLVRSAELHLEMFVYFF